MSKRKVGSSSHFVTRLQFWGFPQQNGCGLFARRLETSTLPSDRIVFFRERIRATVNSTSDHRPNMVFSPLDFPEFRAFFAMEKHSPGTRESLDLIDGGQTRFPLWPLEKELNRKKAM